MMRNIMSIIFLDVDGPINTDRNKVEQARMGYSVSSFRIRLPKHTIQNLKSVVENIPNCKIVLSSKWRLGGTPSPARLNLERQIKPYGLYIYSETPYMNLDRGLEISTWLYKFKTRMGYIPPYIILDNELDTILPSHKGHVVYCDSRNGLTRRGVNISISLLNNFRKEFGMSFNL